MRELLVSVGVFVTAAAGGAGEVVYAGMGFESMAKTENARISAFYY